jgi:hypothetical protein
VSGWSSPFEKWVVKGWAKHAKQIGGAEVAAAVRRSLADPAAAKARAKAALAEVKEVSAPKAKAATPRDDEAKKGPVAKASRSSGSRRSAA